MGSSNVQVCTAAMHHGFRIVEDMIEGLSNYLDEKGLVSVEQLVGRSVARYSNWGDLDLNYKVIAEINNETCIHCNKCHIACEDTSHQAISLTYNEEGTSQLKVIEENCVGCNLCSIVCPTEDAIHMRELPSEAPMTWNQRQSMLANNY